MCTGFQMCIKDYSNVKNETCFAYTQGACECYTLTVYYEWLFVNHLFSPVNSSDVLDCDIIMTPHLS